MPNTKSVGVAFSDPELTSGTTITGAIIDSTSKVLSNIANGLTASQQGATIATTGNSDVFVIAPAAGVLTSAVFSGVDALAASDTNYITFSVTNTTKTTGGTALTANAARTLSINGTAANLVVAAGDRLRIRAAATGTLANTVTFPVYRLNFSVA
jgi:hypothetical protein